MEELIKQLMREARGIWRFRWMVAIVAWIVALVGWTVVIVMPDQYEAEAKVFLDTESLAREALGGMIIEGDVQGRVELVRQMILSRAQLEKVARDTDLDLRATSPESFEALIDGLQRDIKVEAGSVGSRRNTEQTIYRIAYRDHDRKTAENVVQTLLNNLLESSLVEAADESVRAVKFLETQVEEYGVRLNDAEKRLAAFKRQNVGLLPGEGGDYFARLQGEMEKLAAARSSLGIATSRRNTLRAQLAESRVVGSGEDGTGEISPAAELERQIAEQESKLNELLLLYTDKHPDVIATRETVSSLKKRLEDMDPNGLGSGTVGALVYENVQIALNEAEVEVASLASLVSQHEAKVAELQRLVDTIPVVEAQYAQLVRDYGVTRSQYEELLLKLEQAKITAGLGSQGDDVQFRIVEKPAAGIDPVAPNRPRLLFAAFVLALGFGAGLAWMRNQSNPVFESRHEVYEYLGRPVLGSVTMTNTPRQVALQRTERISLVAVNLMLFGAFGVLILLHEPASQFAQRALW
jgi:polysaccharide chain length determinant protein (PEP-CTERM system associated)